jgi:hypothetical protein
MRVAVIVWLRNKRRSTAARSASSLRGRRAGREAAPDAPSKKEAFGVAEEEEEEVEEERRVASAP